MLRLVPITIVLALSCGGSSESEKKPSGSSIKTVDPDEFAKQHQSFERYWYQGKAELSRYDLEQMRYGEKRAGHAIFIFVTEDFRLDRQVKFEGDRTALDSDSQANVASVLKLNAHRRFDTGIYPYSILTSSFSEVDDMTRPIKVSTSVQEWCGHTFSQLNRRADGYDFTLFSYFDSEGDHKAVLPGVLTEDGLWALGRRNPKSLPVGEMEVLPALHVLRFRHVSAQPQSAVGTLRDVQKSPHGRSKQIRYELAYTGFARRLVIYFEAGFPHRPLAWEELDQREGEEARTLGVRREEMMLDYWNHNNIGDAPYRRALGLD